MAKRHYILLCDESAKHGRFFSYFYGGALVAASDQQAIEEALRAKKEELNLFKEIKWTRITENYQAKYIEFIRRYFEFVASGRIKVRVMFSHNLFRPKNLNEEQQENRYFLLYYQLIKHGIGFRYCNPNGIDRVFVSVLLDDMPDNAAKIEAFKNYVSAISQNGDYADCKVFFPKEQMAEIDSKNHVIHQGLDIILGAMQFRLNDLHLEKPEGSARRGKRTIAKEKVYKEINRLIRQIYPNFNIGASTGTPNGIDDRWNLPYSHWKFIPSEHEKDETGAKGKVKAAEAAAKAKE